MAGRVKTWVWVVLAIIVVGILSIVAMAGIGVYYFSQHIDTETPIANPRRTRRHRIPSM